ncbi:hypothetical protein [Sphingosinithalassobacter portus]|uniref:hypothetical protein n=1 Tax=Stakelama portus TaxID=2676234 RepID=UPI0013795BED|nr:hypothetical protein [Sphingosinithalassobacter portus]
MTTDRDFRSRHFGTRWALATRLRLTAMAGVCAALAPLTVHAQDVPEDALYDLGTLGGDRSIATQVNSDGSIVLGYAEDENGGVRMVLWKNGIVSDITLPGIVYREAQLTTSASARALMSRDGSTVMIRATVDLPGGGIYRYRDGTATRIDVPDAPGGLYIEGVTALDRDGSTLVGFSFVDGDQHAVRWTEEGAQDLGTLGGRASSALGVSGDGSVVVGISDLEDLTSEAFRWSNGTMESLGSLPGQSQGSANLISDDGSVIAGYAYVSGGARRVFVWQDGVMSDIGDLGGGPVYATAMSSDGSTIIGQTNPNNPDVADTSQAYYWRDGVMREVGYLPTDNPLGAFTLAEAVSGDGGVIVGSARGETGNNSVAFRWTEETGIVSLGTLGGDSSKATDVSEDGTTVVGFSDNAQGQSRAFIWRSAMQDFANLLASFGGLAEESELAIAEQQHLAEVASMPGCDPSARRFCLGLEGFGWTRAGTASIGRRQAAGIRLSARFTVTEMLRIGGSFVWADPSINGDRSDESDARAWSASLDYGAAGSGPFGRIWYSRAREDLSLVRGEGYADVQAMRGRTRLTSESFGLRAGYGFTLPGNIGLRPWVTVDRRNSDRDAFTDTATANTTGDFPAHFAGIEAIRTIGRGGIDVDVPAGGNRLILGVSLETDLNSDPVAIAGTSDIPGMETFTLTSSLERKDVRAGFTMGYDMGLGPLRVGIGASAKSPVYGDGWQLGGGLRLSADF